MSKANNIFLIGPAGAGKTSVGRALAKQLSKVFYDSDETIEQRTGVNIAWIFDLEGESGFRKRESQIIAELTQHSHIILATGGGAILAEENRRLLSTRGTIIYLSTSLAQQEARVLHDIKRPLLQVSNRTEKLHQLRLQREPLYQEIADFSVSTDKKTVSQVVQEIIHLLKKL